MAAMAAPAVIDDVDWLPTGPAGVIVIAAGDVIAAIVMEGDAAIAAIACETSRTAPGGAGALNARVLCCSIALTGGDSTIDGDSTIVSCIALTLSSVDICGPTKK